MEHIEEVKTKLVNDLERELKLLQDQPNSFTPPFLKGYESCINDVRIILKSYPVTKVEEVKKPNNPLPWRLIPNRDVWQGVEAANGVRVCNARSKADAEFIISVCNSYTTVTQQNEELKKKQPFLGWIHDKDVLNQQREYWGAMNGIDKLREQATVLTEENRKLKEALEHVNHTLVLHGKVDQGTPLHQRIESLLSVETKQPEK